MRNIYVIMLRRHRSLLLLLTLMLPCFTGKTFKKFIIGTDKIIIGFRMIVIVIYVDIFLFFFHLHGKWPKSGDNGALPGRFFSFLFFLSCFVFLHCAMHSPNNLFSLLNQTISKTIKWRQKKNMGMRERGNVYCTVPVNGKTISSSLLSISSSITKHLRKTKTKG